MYIARFETNLDFVAFMKKLVDEYNGLTGTKGKIKYMSSGTMSALTSQNMKTFMSWSPSAWANGKVEAHIKPFLDKPGYFGADCNNIYKAIFWGLDTGKVADIAKYTPNGPGVKRNSNGLGDLGVESLFNICTDISSDLSNILPGEMLGMKGHIGMYYGKIDGVDYVVDVTTSQGGLALNKMSNQRWEKHGKCPFVTSYVTEETSAVDAVEYFNNLIKISKGDAGEKVRQAQAALNHVNKLLSLGYAELKLDGKCGTKTMELADRVKCIYFIEEEDIGVKTIAILCTLNKK